MLTGKNSLLKRSQHEIIVGVSEKTQGYKVLLKRENKVVVTQHVKDIATLSEAQNAQLQRAMDAGDRAGDTKEAETTVAAITSGGSTDGRATARKKGGIAWTRSAHGTRVASKRAEAAARQEALTESGEVVNTAFERDPIRYSEAMRGGKRDGWMKAMREEIAALQSYDVWTIVKRAPGTHALHTKWVYKTETDTQGNLERLTARLVADGSLDGQGDPGTRGHVGGVPAKHSDIPNACVKAEKEAHLRIFLQMPRGMQVSEETLRTHGATSASELVLELRKSLYDLKQAGRLWSLLLHAKLVDAGFVRCESDMCFYWKREGADLVVVGVYVDDLLATGTSAAAVESLFESLASLSIKDLGQVSKFLGMRVQLASEGGHKLDQEEAIGDLVRDSGLVDANPTRTPIGDDCYEIEADVTALLGTTGSKTGATVRDFQSLVGSLLWVARCKLPDIAFAVHKATRQTHAPRMHD
uniref:Reverse transcriptase Ty1/copia-type domain-containing protein n=1 Tax=Peronospora matthiolae TaxID=2874970 RepID=A0AAV1TQJ1_9STRA